MSFLNLIVLTWHPEQVRIISFPYAGTDGRLDEAERGVAWCHVGLGGKSNDDVSQRNAHSETKLVREKLSHNVALASNHQHQL